MACLAAIFKQVEREGARWGLYPEIRDGRVKVCERIPELAPREGAINSPVLRNVVVCSLDESSPLDAWTSVLMHRMGRQHHDFMAMVLKRQERVRKQEERVLAEKKADIRRKLHTALVTRRQVYGPR